MASPGPESAQTGNRGNATSHGKKSLESGLSGTLSGMAIGALLQPLDVVRTRMQGDAARGLAPQRGATGTLMEIVGTGGVGSLWRGTGPSVLRMGLGVGVHMILVEKAAAHLTRPGENGQPAQLSAGSAALAGGGARALVSTCMCPVTVIKTRMEYTGKDGVRYKSTAHAFSTIIRTEGIRGLFRGVVPTVLTNAPFSGLYYMMYTQLKRELAADDRPQFAVNFVSGAVAGAGSTLATQPTDVLRTRMQLGRGQAQAAAGAAAGAAPLVGGTASSSGAAGATAGSSAGTITAAASSTKAASTSGAANTSSSSTTTSTWRTLGKALRQQGPASLFVGMTPRVLKRTLQTSLVWTLYEELVPRLTSVSERVKKGWS
ncbi:hypothetical protein FOA52_007363 [Chlamydomonas sp. UWO 241]|nr:hypothetical protein FOA52_007363 [Chlamydomonas sp. UWO 241]